MSDGFPNNPNEWYTNTFYPYGEPSVPNDFGNSNLGTWTLTFGEGLGVHALGFYVLIGTPSPTPFEVTVTTATGSQYIDDTDFGGVVARYRGYSASDGIRSVRIRNAPGLLGNYNWSVDNVSRSSIVSLVPEPSTLALALLGLISCLALAIRKRLAT